MSKVEGFVRAQGSVMRQHLIGLMLAHGDELGLLVAKRFFWEIAAVIGETHGPTAVLAIIDDARAAIQLDCAPTIDAPDPGPDLLVNAIEGLSTITNQNREVIAALVQAVGHLAQEVRSGR